MCSLSLFFAKSRSESLCQEIWSLHTKRCSSPFLSVCHFPLSIPLTFLCSCLFSSPSLKKVPGSLHLSGIFYSFCSFPTLVSGNRIADKSLIKSDLHPAPLYGQQGNTLAMGEREERSEFSECLFRAVRCHGELQPWAEVLVATWVQTLSFTLLSFFRESPGLEAKAYISQGLVEVVPVLSFCVCVCSTAVCGMAGPGRTACVSVRRARREKIPQTRPSLLEPRKFLVLLSNPSA